VKVCNQKTDIISLDRFPSEYEEAFSSLSEEPCELVHQYLLNLIGLLYADAHTHRVDRGLDEDTFILVAGNSQRIEKRFGGACGFNLGDIVTFGSLAGKVGER
jgi:hypothetical protein